MSSGWRYFAQRHRGDGRLGEFIFPDLPMKNVSIEEVLSGHNTLTGTIDPEVASLKGSDGKPIFVEWGTCIWAEAPNGEVFGGILQNAPVSNSSWQLTCIDLSGPLIGTPYTEGIYFVNVDPMDIFRYLWQWYQAQPGCNLGVNIDNTHSTVRLGTELIQVEQFDEAADDPILDPVDIAPSSYANNAEWVDKAVRKLGRQYGWKEGLIRTALNNWLTPGADFTDETYRKIIRTALRVLGQPPGLPGTNANPTPTVVPVVYQVDAYKLNWYTNLDIDADITDLSADTPFDWVMTHRWSDDGDQPDLFHEIKTGFPRIGTSLDHLRFVIGENIHTIPNIDHHGEEYADRIIAYGAGEGSAMLWTTASSSRDHFRLTEEGYENQAASKVRMSRTRTVSDSSITDLATLQQFANRELRRALAIQDITELVLMDHPHAPLGAVSLGDEFRVEGDCGWESLDTQVRCIGRRRNPDDESSVLLSVMRTDRIA